MAIINGTTADEILDGTEDNDVITPGGGRDIVDGKGGVDRLVLDHSGIGREGRVEININNGSFYGVAYGDYPYDRVDYSNIEEITYQGSSFDDAFILQLGNSWPASWALTANGGGGIDSLAIYLINSTDATQFDASGGEHRHQSRYLYRFRALRFLWRQRQ